MSKKVLLCLLTFFITVQSSYDIPSAVMCEHNSGGLIGDKLFIYIKAKWFAYKYKTRFFYRPFGFLQAFGTEGSSKLMLHTLEEDHYDPPLEKQFKNIVGIGRHNSPNQFAFDKNNSLYKVQLRSYDPCWKKFDKQIKSRIVGIRDVDLHKEQAVAKLRVDLSIPEVTQYLIEDYFYCDELFYAMKEEPVFLAYVRKLLRPRYNLNLVPLPKNKITVALHMRFSGEYEKMQASHPHEISLRAPCKDYYVEQLIRLSKMLHDRPLYVYIFTNHTNPQVLIQELQKSVGKKNIEYGARPVSSNDDNVFEDMFSMAKFDCLIRPNSSFSKISQLIGNHKIVISPKLGIWKNKIFKVTHVHVFVANSALLR